jgi:UPF0755 protein
MTKFWIITILISIVLAVIGITGFNVYGNFYTAPSDAPTGNYVFTVKKGDTLSVIAAQLEKDKIIKSRSAFLIQEQLNPISPIQEGQYSIKLNKENPEGVLQLIDAQTKEITANISKNQKPSVRVTIREGLTLDQVFAILEQNKLVKASEMTEFAKKPSNFNKQTYEFLPEPLSCNYGDIKTCAEYYIEGFIYPNTYDFFVPSTPTEIFKKFLDTFNQTVWQKVKSNLNGKDFQKAIVMASVIEKETGRTKNGINDSNRAEVNEERKNVAGVFYNRIENGMKWESNITVEYGTGRRTCEQTLKLDNCLYLDDPDAKTQYNTYQISSYPIAPITSPEYDCIVAALNPTKNDYLFFVSDATGKTYFSSTDSGHVQNIQKVQQINRSLGV